MYEVEVNAGRADPMPEEIGDLLLAEALHTTPMALQDWPAHYVGYYRIIQHARATAQEKGTRAT